MTNISKICDRSSMVEQPVPTGDGGSIPTRSLQLIVEEVPVFLARDFIAKHHSRLPYTQVGPWKFAFGVFDIDRTLVATALWHNCSARGLPKSWLELRRMAIANNSPRNTASFVLAQMCRWMRKNTSADVVISYQDVSVHRGTIYKAAGWVPTTISRPRLRDRSKNRSGTTRKYRSDSNGKHPAASAKIRWQLGLHGQKFDSLSVAEIETAQNMVATK